MSMATIIIINNDKSVINIFFRRVLVDLVYVIFVLADDRLSSWFEGLGLHIYLPLIISKMQISDN